MPNVTDIAEAGAAALDTIFAGLAGDTAPTIDDLTAARNAACTVFANGLDMVGSPDMELKFDPSGVIAGYASCFDGPADAVGDVVAPGAFRGSPMPKMLKEHKGAPIGEWTAITEDEIGLRVAGRVTDPATLADLRSGRLDGLSIGYVATKSRKDTAGRRVLEQVNLQEISVVKRPASSRARVLSVKSANAGKESTMDYETAGTADDVVTTETKSFADAIGEALAPVVSRLDKLETVSRRPGAIERKSEGENHALETKAFSTFIRRGREALDHTEIKSLRVSDDTAGGYLSPDQFVAELLKNLVLYSPIRSLARVMSVSASNVILPKRTSTLTANWVGEIADRTSTSPAYGQVQFPIAEMAAYTDVSNALLEDAAFDIASELSNDFAEQFGKVEATAFVNGNGVNKPYGFMSSADLLSTNSGGASTITAEGLIQLFHDLAPAYRNNGTWVMNSSTLGTIRKLKDGSTGTFLLMTSGIGNSPSTTLLGRPVVEAPDMPDVAGGAYPVVFGDFTSGYRIFDRLALSVLRDPYSVATNGLTRFHARRRVAGGVAKAEALRKLKISA